jgi:hypothetical protein
MPTPPLPILFRPATSKDRNLRVCISGISGSGKTYTALLVAKALTDSELAKPPLLVLDTEQGNSSIYAREVPHDVYTMEGSFSPVQYQKVLEAAGGKYGVVVLDTISPEWEGDGGVLQIVDSIGKFKGWQTGTPMHNAFLNALVRYPGHIIATSRCAMDHVVEKDAKSGETSIRKVGLGLTQRKGVEHEFDVVLMLDDRGMATTYKNFRSTMPNPPKFPMPREEIPGFLVTLGRWYRGLQ